MDPEKKSLNFIFPTKYVIPKSLKFSHWLSEEYKIDKIHLHKLHRFVIRAATTPPQVDSIMLKSLRLEI